MVSIDFSKCRICSPSGEQLLSMYKILWELFPYDRAVYDEMIRTGSSFYTLKNYALYRDDEFLGNLGLMPMTIWFSGKPLQLIGVGAVATVPQYRRQGIAKYLMNRSLEIIDAEEKASVLFTELPVVYEEHGFEIVSQSYLAGDFRGYELESGRFQYQVISEINDHQVEEMSRVYDSCAAYDGKMIRDMEYWKLYKMLFNPYLKPKICLCRDRENQLAGYVRFETEADRFTVTEFCGNSDEIVDGLLGFVANLVKENSVKLVTLAIAPGHSLFKLLDNKGIVLAKEPPGVRREIFMVRPARGREAGALAKLQWSLADKF